MAQHYVRGQWPAGANDTERKSYRCPRCGAVSSTPLNCHHKGGQR